MKKPRKRQTDLLNGFLEFLDETYQETREPMEPLYPYDQKTNTIALPDDLEEEVRQLVLSGRKPAAMKRVIELTGAGLRVSKDYVDSLVNAGAE
jgi:hypothetical protein